MRYIQKALFSFSLKNDNIIEDNYKNISPESEGFMYKKLLSNPHLIGIYVTGEWSVRGDYGRYNYPKGLSWWQVYRDSSRVGSGHQFDRYPRITIIKKNKYHIYETQIYLPPYAKLASVYIGEINIATKRGLLNVKAVYKNSTNTLYN